MANSIPYPQHNIRFMIREPGGSSRTMVLRGEDICPSSLSGLTSNYIHPTSVGRVALPRIGAEARVVAGEVIACQYISGKDHRVVFRFSENIALDGIVDPTALHEVQTEEAAPEAPPVSVLYIDDHEADRRLLETRLEGSNILLETVEHLGGALDTLRSKPFDLILCDLHLENDITAHDLLRSVVSRSIATPVAVLTSDIDPQIDIELSTDGVIAVINKPIDHNSIAFTLTAIAHQSRRAPDRSPEHREATIEFEESLANRRDQLALAREENDCTAAVRICMNLAGVSAGYGFVSLGRAADRAIGAIDATQSVQAAGKPIDDLISSLDRYRAA